MNKAQSYIYVVVIVLLLFGVAVFWSNKEEITPANANEPVVDLSDTVNNIDTSDWKTFRHEVYPYEIKYPAGAEINTRSITDPSTKSNPKNEVEVIVRSEQAIQYLYIYVEKKGFSDLGMNLTEYLNQRKQRSEEPSDGEAITISDTVPININGWNGYKTVTTYEISGGNEVNTEIFILNRDILYRIIYREADTITPSIVNTLYFLE